MKETVDYSKLISDAVNGNQAAYNELYNLTVQSAYRTATLLLNNADDVEDVLQNSYSKAFARLNELKDPEKFESWLKTIVENESKNYIKKSKRISAPIIFIKNKVEDSSEEWNRPVPQEYLEREELRKSVTEILDKLSPEVRACIVLFHYENKSMNEIAEILDIPLGTVKSRIYNGRKQIEKEFNKLRKKDPTLYGVAAIPAFLTLLALKAESITVPATLSQAVFASATGTAIAGASTAAAGTSAVAAGTVTTVSATATAASTAIAAKVVAVAVAGTVAVGGTTVAVKNHIDKKAAEEASSSYSTTFAIEETCTVTQATYEIISVSVQELSTFVTLSETELSITQASGNTTKNNATSTESETTAKSTTTKPVTTRPTTTKATTTARATTTTRPSTTKTTTAPQTTNPENNYALSTGVITAYNGSDTNVSIPSSINSNTVTAIGSGAFAGNTSIRSVSIPSTVTQIGQEAFADCTSLTSVSLPSSLDIIGIGAFYNCPSLTSVSVPSGTETIDDEAFAQCTNLSTITIPSSVTSISADAFDGCDSLTIRCTEGSVAHNFAVENGIDYSLI